MPGPGPHMIYALGSGLGLMSVSGGRFGPHHCVAYAVNAFFGPDVGSFSEWLFSTVGMSTVAGAVEGLVHNPFYYPLVLGLPFSLLYCWASRVALSRGFLDSPSGVPLTQWQCFLLISAGSLSHFFLDHLFEENGRSTMYTWILSTGWWTDERAPINPGAVLVIGFLCTCLIAGFIYINRVRSPKSIRKQHIQSVKLVAVIGSLYCLWCASQVYMVTPRQPAIGEECDLGVLVFLFIFFFTPHYLCIKSMSLRDHAEEEEEDKLPV